MSTSIYSQQFTRPNSYTARPSAGMVSTSSLAASGNSMRSEELPPISLLRVKPRRPVRRSDAFSLSGSTSAASSLVDITVSEQRGASGASKGFDNHLETAGGRDRPHNNAEHGKSSIQASCSGYVMMYKPDSVFGSRTLSIQQRPRKVRRETMFVLPDETTTTNIVTPSQASQASQECQMSFEQHPRDIFFDLATLPEDSPLRVNAKASRPQRRESLFTQPRKGPLGQIQTISRSNTLMSDIPGDGAGKENVPPGQHQRPQKLGRRSSAAFTKPMPGTFDKLKVLDELCESGATVPHRSAEKPANRLPNISSKAARRMSGYVLSKELPVSLPPTNTHLHSLSERRTSSSGHKTRRTSSLAKDRTEGLHRLTMLPEIQESRKPYEYLHCSTSGSFIETNVQYPELYETTWLSKQEEAIAYVMNDVFAKSQPNQSEWDAPTCIRNHLLDTYQTQYFVFAYKRLSASLQFGALSLPTSTIGQAMNFKSDLGQRKRFIDLWMKTYDLHLLRAAAEVVTGHIAPTCKTSHQTPPASPSRKGLAVFLTEFLVDHSDARSNGSRGPNGFVHANRPISSEDAASAWRTTMLRSLLIISLLDRLKQDRRCIRMRLFQANSPYKASVDVLQAACKLLLPSAGNAVKVLNHLGLELTHVQYPLEEYSYAIENIAIDMRDGVRLARLVENFLPLSTREMDHTLANEQVNLEGDPAQPQSASENPWMISQHLKYPCISRTQMMFNVELSLSALRKCSGIAASIEDIRADDIVDGHREQTIRLLWVLFSRWGLDAITDADLIRAEIRRIAQITTKDASEVQDLECSADRELQEHTPGRLLMQWAQSVSGRHGIRISNATTCFANDDVYRLIIEEYAPYISKSNTQSSRPLQSSNRTDRRRGILQDGLASLGCSKSFTQLFLDRGGIPSPRSTISMLGFLASRILPIARPAIAATTIQRAWRNSQTRQTIQQRLVLAVLARDCASVVQTRWKIEWAARRIQEKWKGVSSRRKALRS